MVSDLFAELHFAYIFAAAILFMVGVYFAPAIVDRNIRWMLVYPRWVARLIEKYFSGRWGFLTIFFVIIILNNISLFSSMISGYLIFLPFLMAFFTGFHVAVIGYDMMGWQGIWHLLVNPVAWLEFPAAWISLGMGMRISAVIISSGNFSMAHEVSRVFLPLYVKYVLVLLIIAGLLETALIRWAEKHKDNLK